MVLTNLANTLLAQSRFPEARNSLRWALELAPDMALAHERLGYCCFRLRQYPEALDSYQRAVDLQPDLADAHTGLGVCRMALYLQKPTDRDLRRLAIEAWQRSLALNPNQPRIRNLAKKYQLSDSETSASMMDLP